MIMSNKVAVGKNRAAQQFSDSASLLRNGNMRVSVLESVRYPIVMACDEAYAMPLATTLRSLVESDQSGGCLDIFVLTSRFSAEKRQKVLHSLPGNSALIHWVPVELALFRNFSTQSYISTMTYARLLLPYIFPDSVLRILYIDADILVIDDLKRLWGIDLGGAVLGAVVDTYSLAHSTRLKLDANTKTPKPGGASASHRCEYFNAGVLLVDLPRWRQERISERAMEYLGRHPQTLLSDQDALNAVCVDGWKPLNKRWNFQDHDLIELSRVQPEHRPSVIHFAGRQKPWNAGTLNINAEFYDGYRSRTKFNRTFIDKIRDAIVYNWAWFKHRFKPYKSAVLSKIELLRAEPH